MPQKNYWENNLGNIFQPGIIASVAENKITVTVRCKSSCMHCQVKSNCAMADTRLKNITIPVEDTSCWRPGQKVMLALDEHLGWIAVFWGYILPLFLVFGVLFISLAFTADETLSGLLSLGILLPYYLMLAAFRKKLSNRFKIRILAE